MAEYAALAHDAQREAFQNDGERRVAAGRACPIERLEWGTLTPAEFAERFVAAGRPVIFTDAMSSYATRPQDWLTKDGFVAAFGEIEAKAGTGAELAQYGGRSDRPPMKLRDIVDQFGSQTDPDNELFVFDMQVSAQLKRSFEEPSIFTDTFMAPFKGEAKWNMLSLGWGWDFILTLTRGLDYLLGSSGGCFSSQALSQQARSCFQTECLE
jgi:hypothetical protein